MCQEMPYYLKGGPKLIVTGRKRTARFQCNAVPSANLRALNCDAYDQLRLHAAAKRSRRREVELAGQRAHGVLGLRTDVLMQLSGVAAIWNVANANLECLLLKERGSQALCQRPPALWIRHEQGYAARADELGARSGEAAMPEQKKL